MPTVAVNGTELNYIDEGPSDAPAIVFSHSLFFDSTMFQAQADHFAGSHRVIRYDQRGQGASAAAPADQLDMDTLADDAAALIEHLGIAPCHFVGNSMGGFIALRLAARRPELLRSATVIGSSGEEEHKLAEFQPLVDSLAENGTASAIDILMHIMLGDTFLADPDRAEERNHWRDQMLALPPRIADAANGVIHRKGVLDELSDADVPILVLACAEDHAYELALSENIAAAAPLARLEVVPASGHSGALEAPDVVNEHLGTLIHQVDTAVGAAS
ncbi:MAG: 3-oxoadipate enol-lactonase [Thermoleophilaceae bacterium]|nr:3-oxoadipate enol-lactonase [Thermoleophilaceae bacterium]